MKTMISAPAKKILLATVLVFAFTDAALAAVRTVTLSVPGMYCAVCPITVKKALEKVPGVSQVNVSFEKKDAVVTFDDAKTNIKALEDATFEAGYPSTVQEEKTK
ncbi:mercury resistance system periplasmic binding protein MerP [Halothiobacillus sp.]|jgi:mercuric ion binding protein|uniref:mercury resistance system periplasmic binding protein MerP n=1 Tax=Halothiobacillus sp. TaxID=1891311 RepID=UPI002983606B|nr:mercury resistance system periplasmic binding protein MerP [Halothiobacillus sp.]MDY0146885.1 mercury resistance system periplasmic binding protein MerP [Halothiobacillus sp.]